MKTISAIGLMFFICFGQSWAQSKSQYMSAAEQAKMEKNYYAALSYYHEALQFDTTDINVQYQVADAARLFSSYKMAAKYYREVVNSDDEGIFPLSTYYLGEMYQMLGDYEGAKKYYQIYLSEEEGEDAYYTARAKKEISSTDWASSMQDKNDDAIIISQYEGVNTPNSEFGAVLEDNGITYSSLAYQPTDAGEAPVKPIAKVLKNQGGIADLYTAINDENLHTAHTAYNINRSKVFYTICEYNNASDIRCDMYSRAIRGDGSLGDQIKLPETINGPNHTTTQPSVGFSQAMGKEVLYFASDRQGGEGKLDVWYVTIDGVNEYSTPVNVSAVNTAEDDITPFYHNNSQALYFSSDGYTSLGGFDIYRSFVSDDGGFGKVENMGAPVNSSYNDIYYALSADGDKLLLSSNREGSAYIDELNESCCYDIYQGEVTDLEINLNVLTYDAKTLDSLKGVMVQLFDVNTGELVAEMQNSIGSNHPFAIDRGKRYMVVSSLPGYAPDTMLLNTNRINRSQDITRKVYLQRTSLDLQVFTFDDISKLPLPGTTVRLIDLTDRSIQEVKLTNTIGHDFVFMVKPGHKYRIIAEKDRFVTASTELVADDEDGSGILVRKLFLERKDLNIYLPLALYFDNDRPDEKTISLTTKRDYTSTFDKYVFQKQVFKDNYGTGLSGADKVLAEQRIDDFFEQDVKGGYDKFRGFLAAMLRGLNNGKKYELSIRGFASPRADSRYNLALSQRRVVSVQNEINTYENGAFLPFVESGMLKITQLSYGENLAPTDVSDVLANRRKSIYSPEASRERRAEIVEIKTELINE